MHLGKGGQALPTPTKIHELLLLSDKIAQSWARAWLSSWSIRGTRLWSQRTILCQQHHIWVHKLGSSWIILWRIGDFSRQVPHTVWEEAHWHWQMPVLWVQWEDADVTVTGIRPEPTRKASGICQSNEHKQKHRGQIQRERSMRLTPCFCYLLAFSLISFLPCPL